MLLKLRKLTRDDSVTRFLQNGALFFSTKQASMAQKSPHKVQALYDLCKKTFTSGTPPLSSPSVQKLCSLLDTIGPADVGLPENEADLCRHGFFQFNHPDRGWVHPITYVDIHKCESFTMCIYCFTSYPVIKLHHHPDRTVFSKVLCGSLHVRAYDWVEPARVLEPARILEPDCVVEKSRPVRLAKLAVEKDLTASCTTSVWHPKSSGILRGFLPDLHSAVLVILTPPYKEDAGQRCTCYHEVEYSRFLSEFEKTDEEEWLLEVGPQRRLCMRPGKYDGPSIQV